MENEKTEEYPALTTDVIEANLTDEERKEIEEGAQSIIESTVRVITTEQALRDLAVSWTVMANEYRHSATMLCRMFDTRLTREYDAYQPINTAWIKAKVAERAVELLGIPAPDPECDELSRRPGESPYEYIKRTESMRS